MAGGGGGGGTGSWSNMSRSALWGGSAANSGCSVSTALERAWDSTIRNLGTGTGLFGLGAATTGADFGTDFVGATCRMRTTGRDLIGEGFSGARFRLRVLGPASLVVISSELLPLPVLDRLADLDCDCLFKWTRSERGKYALAAVALSRPCAWRLSVP
jgi:hypothetical protein